MTPDQLYTLVLVSAAVTVLICLAIMWHADQDAELGRDLREAAGDESHARRAIEDADLCRCLRRKDEQTDEAIRIGIRHLARTDKVLHFPPQLRVVRQGRPLDFPPDGGGEAA